MLPRTSRLKSLASELSPVLTTPPPVDPNTVLVLMSVPEMMLSSNLVVLRRRDDTSTAMRPRMAAIATPSAHNGMASVSWSKNDGAGFTGVRAIALGAALGTTTGVVAGVAGVSAAFVASVAGVVGGSVVD